MSEPGVAEQEPPLQDISPFAVGKIVLLYRQLVVRSWLLFVALAIVYLLLRSSGYVASSRFVPELPAGGASQLAGLAAQFGVTLGVNESSAPLAFYAQLLTTRDVLRHVALKQYQIVLGSGGKDTLSGAIADLYGLEAKTPELRLRRAIALLRSRVSVGADLKTGTVGIEVTARWAALAEMINRELLNEANEFNLSKRQSLAAAERRFTEARSGQAQQELQSAEAELERFLEQNRGYENSPRLAFDAARLRRQVDFKQQIYASLALSFEQARIAEVRNTPVITVVETPERSATRAGRSVLKVLFLAVIGGGMLAVSLAFAREYFERQRRLRPNDWAEIGALGRTAASESALLWDRVHSAARLAWFALRRRKESAAGRN